MTYIRRESWTWVRLEPLRQPSPKKLFSGSASVNETLYMEYIQEHMCLLAKNTLLSVPHRQRDTVFRWVCLIIDLFDEGDISPEKFSSNDVIFQYHTGIQNESGVRSRRGHHSGRARWASRPVTAPRDCPPPPVQHRLWTGGVWGLGAAHHLDSGVGTPQGWVINGKFWIRISTQAEI